MINKIHVVINPASGPNQPILNTLNDVFTTAGVEWDVSITKKAGDARRFASNAAAAGVDAVAIYGGDGSVMEAASGLMGGQVPLGILPGGTGNVVSVELGIPHNLAKAAALVCEGPHKVRDVDMGLLNDQQYFILRLAMGFEAEMTYKTDRQLKDRAGKLAYTLGGLMALKEPLNARYKFILDGEVVEAKGVSCMVANTGNMGIPGVNLAPGSDVGDGLLDVVIFQKAERESIFSILTFSVSRSDKEIQDDLSRLKVRYHRKARSITVEADPPQRLNVDGEIIGTTPCRIEVIPQAVKIIVPT